uniref:Uncharacterized protein n=1 Tax=viral metagenome TaxID=1070528 RepID=A0A6M3MCN3_9ZZZZ
MKKLTEKEKLGKQLEKRRIQFYGLHGKIVVDINKYLDKEPGIHSNIRQVEVLTDDICLFGAWITDRLEGKPGTPDIEGYDKSLSKKIRKALGYTL